MCNRIVKESEDEVIILDELDYIRARLISTEAFQIIVIEWNPPNYGYYVDGMLWIKSLHMADWKPYPIASWTGRYKNKEDFLKDYPEFKKLFFKNLDISRILNDFT